MKNFDEWHERYKTKEVIHIKSNLDSNDIEILRKLGIEIEDKTYTCYEFDVIDGELILYYLDDDMTEDELIKAYDLENNTKIEFGEL